MNSPIALDRGKGHFATLFSLLMLAASPAVAQLNQNCVVAVLNRTVQVNADGSWLLPNVPANFGLVRARATCVQNGVTTFGQSALFTIPTNGAVNLPTIQFGNTTPIPTAINISAQTTTLSQAGATVQLAVTATYATGPTQDVTQSSAGTQYNISNPAIATIGANGLVTAVSTGTVAIQAVNEGTSGIIDIQVVLAGVSHGGIPDTWAIANGLDPNDPAMPSEDPDHDGLTNLQEFQQGTNPNNPDTDGDGLTDGQEVLMYHTNPLLFSTDGTGISDGIEVQTGTLGLTLTQKLAKAISTLAVTPATFVLDVNSIQSTASQQLTVNATLIDGKTVVNLTSTATGTNYSSSDLTICNFGSPDGNVFAGNGGSCTITVTNSGFTAKATGTVVNFTPTSLSFIPIPGFANGVAVNGNYAYVAAGSAGLQVVNVANRSNPSIVASLALAGNSNDIRLLGNLVYIAGGSAGLQVVDITNPLAPVLRGTLATGENALDLAVYGSTAYIANGSNLFLVNVTNPATMTQIGTLALSGTIQGVDFDPVRKLAVVAGGTSGVYVVDLSNPAAPVMRGKVSTGNAYEAVIRGNYAFVADYVNSTTSVDITVPTAPLVLSNITDPNLGGFLQDIVLSGNFALAADVKFVNGIPITDITNPAQLLARAILNFPQRDDNGMGIAADGSYAYLVTEHSSLVKFGTTGDSRLYIGQYLALQDLKGIPPSASITAPTAGSTVIQGAILPISVNATDDVAVAAVNFLVNGQLVFTATTAPYQYNYTVPAGISSLTLGATAVDFGGNVGTAQNVLIGVIPDPLTTVTGTVMNNGQPVAGAAVTVFSTYSSVTGANGTFSISGVPTVRGSIVAFATATISGSALSGASTPASPVAGAVTNVGTISLGQGFAVVTSDTGETVYVIDLGKQAITSTLKLGTDTISVKITPDGTTALVTSFDSRLVTFLNLTTSPPQVLGSVSTPIAAEDLSITTSPAGFAVVSDGGGSTTILSINIATRQIASTLALPISAEGITVTPNGLVLANSYGSNVIRLVNLSASGILTDTGISVPSGGTGTNNVTVSPDGQIALVADEASGSIEVLRIGAGTSVTEAALIPSFTSAQSIAFTPDGRHAYVAQDIGQVGVLNIDTADNVTDSGIRISGIGTVESFFGVDQIAVSSSGTTVLVHAQGVVSFINVATNTIVATIVIPNDSTAGGIAVH